MKKFALTCVVTGAALLTGCASTSQNKPVESTPSTSAATPAATSAPAANAAAVAMQPVRVPAASTKKVVLHMTGAKASVDARDWSGFKDEWRATFADHAKAAGINFVMQDGDAMPPKEDGTLLSVHVNDYRQVGIGARIFLGIMSGNAFIDAKVAFSDLKTGQRFGEQAYNTTSSAWHGVFAKMTPQQVDAIASGVFGEIKVR